MVLAYLQDVSNKLHGYHTLPLENYDEISR